MGKSYAMTGFEIFVEGDFITARAEGDRTVDSTAEPTRLLHNTIDRHPGVRGLVLDVRAAKYAYSDLELAERAKVLARLWSNLIVAIIVQPSQTEIAERIVKAHRKRNGRSAYFRSTSEARAWLRTQLDTAVCA